MNAPAHAGEGPRQSQPERFADRWPYARSRESHLRIAYPLRDAQFSQRVCGEQAFGKRRVSCRIYGTPEWRNGRRGGLKIRWSQGRVGSTPSSGTTLFIRCLTEAVVSNLKHLVIQLGMS